MHRANSLMATAWLSTARFDRFILLLGVVIVVFIVSFHGALAIKPILDSQNKLLPPPVASHEADEQPIKTAQIKRTESASQLPTPPTPAKRSRITGHAENVAVVAEDEDVDSIGQHSAEYALYHRLLGSSRYQKHVRPVRDHHQPIKVKVGMCVMMIEEIVERDQLLTMAACIKMRWTDDFLIWKPENYDNLTWLAISSTNIWLPDIAIINSPEPYELTRKSTNVDVDFRGEVGFFPSGRLATRCNLQITYFPFDWQHCEVRLESWIYPTQYLEIEMYPDDTVDLKEYYTNHQWAVAGYRVLPEVADYDGKNFSSITFTFILRRKSEYYFMYFIFPQLLLALLQTLSHTLPVEHPGRMAMLTSLFIGTSVTQAGVAVHIPKSSDSMSLLQIYMTIMSCNLVLALVVTFVMMYAVLRYPNEEPSFIAMMVAFFSIVWPNDADRRSHLAVHAPVYNRRQSMAGVNRRSSSPYVIQPSKPNTPRKSRTPSSDREAGRHRETAVVPSEGGGHHSRRSSRRSSPNNRPNHHEERSRSPQTKQPQPIPSPLIGKELTNLRKLLQSPRQPSFSPPACNNRKAVTDRQLSSSSAVKRLTFSENSDNEDYMHFRSPNDQSSSSDNHRKRPKNLPLQHTVTTKQPNGSIPNYYQHDLIAKPSNRRQPFAMDTPSDVLGLGGMGDSYSPMNPNVRTPATPRMLENGSLSSKMQSPNDKAQPGGSNSHSHHHSRGQHGKNKGRRDRSGERGRPGSRGEAASAEDTRELKRRWLLYCVALDKTIMYANLVWNIIVPLLLFAIVPVLSPHPFLHVASDS